MQRLGWGIPLLVVTATLADGYAIVASKKTASDPAWQAVTRALAEGRDAAAHQYADGIGETREALRQTMPRYVCFVAQPEEVTREFVADVHRLMRRLDEDPYPDALWGILTGYDAANALRLASRRPPLTVRKAAAATEIALEMCEEGLWYCELKQGRMVRKRAGGKPKEEQAPPDTTEALVRTLTEYQADLFVTSGHATERDWQIGYAYRNGSFRCQDGTLYGLDTEGNRHPIRSPNPKLYLPVGNCLMGHIDGRDAMALAFLNSAGVRQMFGYTVPTWYGYAGWGMLDYFLEQPGRYTFAEAFFANQIALVHRLCTYFPEAAETPPSAPGRVPRSIAVSEKARGAGLSSNDGRGLLFDRDVVAFYGDPAWEARMAERPLPWEQNLSWKAGQYVFEIRPRQGEQSFSPINTNGSQRGDRPFVHFLPHRVKNIRIEEGEELQPVISDNFILAPKPKECQPEGRYRVVFRAERIQ
jgi:zinc protease